MICSNRGKHFGRIPDFRILQRVLLRVRDSGGTEIRGERLQDNATVRDGQFTTGSLMSIVIAVLTSVYCADILRSMQTPENIFHGAYYYLLVTFIGVPCTFFYNLLSSIIRALGDSKTPFWFLLFSTVLNIVLDLFCILVLGWGVLGAGIATVVSQGVSALLCYFYMYKHFPVLKGTADDRNTAFHWLKIFYTSEYLWDFNSPLRQSAASCSKVPITLLGTACVAAFTAAMRIKMFFICAFEA